MATSQNRHYRVPQDSDVDWRDVVGDLARDVDADVTSIVANGLGGGGVPNGTVTSVQVAANSGAWTDSGVVVTYDQPFIIEAEGEWAHAPNTPLYGPYATSGVYLVWAILPDGSIPPDGPSPLQKDYRIVRSGHRLAGRLVYKSHDPGGAGDNVGSLTVKTRVFPNLTSVLAPLSELVGLRDSINGLASRVSALEAR